MVIDGPYVFEYFLVDGGHSIYRVYSHRSTNNAIIGLAVLKLSNFKFDLVCY